MVSVNDLVIFPDRNVTYWIQDRQSNIMWLQCRNDNTIYPLSISNNMWIFQNIRYDKITFFSPNMLTNIPEVDMNILLYMDDSILIRISECNAYVKNLVTDNYFWSMRIEKDFPHIQIDTAFRTRKREYYVHLQSITHDAAGMSLAAGLGTINVVKYLLEQGIVPTQYVLHSAMRNNRSEIIELLLQSKHKFVMPCA